MYHHSLTGSKMTIAKATGLRIIGLLTHCKEGGVVELRAPHAKISLQGARRENVRRGQRGICE